MSNAMDDRALLEMAARANGMNVLSDPWPRDVGENEWFYNAHNHGGGMFNRCDGRHTQVRWNPLADDGDALRLSVKCELNILRGYYGVSVEHPPADNGEGGVDICEPYGKDECAATRRAIVIAAAEIGKQMP